MKKVVLCIFLIIVVLVGVPSNIISQSRLKVNTDTIVYENTPQIPIDAIKFGKLNDTNPTAFYLFKIQNTGIYRVNVTYENNGMSYVNVRSSIYYNETGFDSINGEMKNFTKTIQDAYLLDSHKKYSWTYEMKIISPSVFYLQVAASSQSSLYLLDVAYYASISPVKLFSDNITVDAGTNNMEWPKFEKENILFLNFRVSDGLYNVTIKQETEKAELAITESQLKLLVANFNPSAENVSVFFNNKLVGYVYKNYTNSFEITPESIIVGDVNNISVLFVNTTITDGLDLWFYELVLSYEDGSSVTYPLSAYLNLNSENNTLHENITVTHKIGSPTVSYELFNTKYGSSESTFSIGGNTTTTKYFYLNGDGYVLIIKRSFSANVSLEVAVSPVNTIELRPNSRENFVFHYDSYQNERYFVLISCDKLKYYDIYFSLVKGGNWSLSVYTLDGDKLGYYLSVGMKDYKNSESYVIRDLFEFNFTSSIISSPFARYSDEIVFNGYYRVLYNGTPVSYNSFSEHIPRARYMVLELIATPILLYDWRLFTPSETVEFKMTLSKSDDFRWLRSNTTIKFDEFNTTVGPVKQIFLFNATIGNEYYFEITPVKYEHAGTISVIVGIYYYTYLDWIKYFTRYTKTVSNRTLFFEYIPTVNGIGYISVTVDGDCSNVTIRMQELPALDLSVSKFDVNFKYNDTLKLYKMSVEEGYCYKLKIENSEPAVISLIFFDEFGKNPFINQLNPVVSLNTLTNTYLLLTMTYDSTGFVPKRSGTIYFIIIGVANTHVTLALERNETPYSVGVNTGLALGVIIGIVTGVISSFVGLKFFKKTND